MARKKNTKMIEKEVPKKSRDAEELLKSVREILDAPDRDKRLKERYEEGKKFTEELEEKRILSMKRLQREVIL